MHVYVKNGWYIIIDGRGFLNNDITIPVFFVAEDDIFSILYFDIRPSPLRNKVFFCQQEACMSAKNYNVTRQGGCYFLDIIVYVLEGHPKSFPPFLPKDMLYRLPKSNYLYREAYDFNWNVCSSWSSDSSSVQ